MPSFLSQELPWEINQWHVFVICNPFLGDASSFMCFKYAFVIPLVSGSAAACAQGILLSFHELCLIHVNNLFPVSSVCFTFGMTQFLSVFTVVTWALHLLRTPSRTGYNYVFLLCTCSYIFRSTAADKHIRIAPSVPVCYF